MPEKMGEASCLRALSSLALIPYLTVLTRIRLAAMAMMLNTYQDSHPELHIPACSIHAKQHSGQPTSHSQANIRVSRRQPHLPTWHDCILLPLLSCLFLKSTVLLSPLAADCYIDSNPCPLVHLPLAAVCYLSHHSTCFHAILACCASVLRTICRVYASNKDLYVHHRQSCQSSQHKKQAVYSQDKCVDHSCFWPGH